MGSNITKIENKVYGALKAANKKAADLQAMVDKYSAEHDRFAEQATAALKSGDAEKYSELSQSAQTAETRRADAAAVLSEVESTPQITKEEYEALSAEIYAAFEEECISHKKEVRQYLDECVKIRAKNKELIERADKVLEALQGGLYRYADLNGEPRRTNMGENRKVLRFRDVSVKDAVYDAVSRISVRNLLCEVNPKSGQVTDRNAVKWFDGPLDLD